MYKFNEPIAKGGFGTVYRATYGESVQVAIKKGHGWDKGEGVDPSLLREIQILKQIGNTKGILPLIDQFHHKEDLCLVFPLADMSLHKALQTNNFNPWSITRDLLSGLHELHKMGIVHRDITPGNLLLMNGRLKISDFGMAIQTKMIQFEPFEHHYVCTPEYRAPELVCASDYGIGVDVWSAGCVIWQIFEGTVQPLIKAPRWTDKDMKKPDTELVKQHLKRIQQSVPLTSFPCEYENILKEISHVPTVSKYSHLSTNVRLLLCLCLTPDPIKRPNCREILKSLSTFVNDNQSIKSI
jgi:serine/threonine protein kinase